MYVSWTWREDFLTFQLRYQAAGYLGCVELIWIVPESYALLLTEQCQQVCRSNVESSMPAFFKTPMDCVRLVSTIYCRNIAFK